MLKVQQIDSLVTQDGAGHIQYKILNHIIQLFIWNNLDMFPPYKHIPDAIVSSSLLPFTTSSSSVLVNSNKIKKGLPSNLNT